MSAPMSQPKAAASLSSGLLARKGQARPAMRPQGFSGFGTVSDAMDDLGWNDMGQHEQAEQPEAPSRTPTSLAAMTPADPTPVVAQVPPVLRQRETLKEEFEQAAPVAPIRAAEPAAKSISVATAQRIGRESQAKTKKSKAAFTLRLDGDRHLRLRLASAVCNRSSQMLVTEALDAFLESLPEVEALAEHLPAKAGSKNGNGS